MADITVKYTRDLVVTQGKTHFEVSLLLKEVYPRRRGLSCKSVLEGFVLRMHVGYTRRIVCQMMSWNSVRRKLLLGLQLVCLNCLCLL